MKQIECSCGEKELLGSQLGKYLNNVLQKMTFPYWFCSSFDCFKEKKIPSKDYFKDLSLMLITDEDYEIAHSIYKDF